MSFCLRRLRPVHVQTLTLSKNPRSLLFTREDKQLGVKLLKKRESKRALVQTKSNAALELTASGGEVKWTDEYLQMGCTLYFDKAGKPNKKKYKLQVISVGAASPVCAAGL